MRGPAQLPLLGGQAPRPLPAWLSLRSSPSPRWCRARGAAVWTGSTPPQDSGCPVFRGRRGWTLLARVRLAGVGASLTGGHMVGPCCQPPVTGSSPLLGTPSSLLILDIQAPRPGCVQWGQPSRAISPRHTPVHCPETEVGMPSPPTMSTGPSTGHLLDTCYVQDYSGGGARQLSQALWGNSASWVLLWDPSKAWSRAGWGWYALHPQAAPWYYPVTVHPSLSLHPLTFPTQKITHLNERRTDLFKAGTSRSPNVRVCN